MRTATTAAESTATGSGFCGASSSSRTGRSTSDSGPPIKSLVGSFAQDPTRDFIVYPTELRAHHFLPGVLADLETARGAFQHGDLPRGQNRGHECHLFRPEELRAHLTQAGFHDLQLSSNGCLSMVWPDDSLPLPGSEAWQFLVDAELDAGTTIPGAGTHMIAWATK